MAMGCTYRCSTRQRKLLSITASWTKIDGAKSPPGMGELMAWYREGIEAEKKKRRLAEVEAELAKTKITPEQPDQEPEQYEPLVSW
jgi:hypothetical protein